MGYLPCVSIIAESRIIDDIYLISWLNKILWNCYVLIKLLFQIVYFLRTLMFSKQLYISASATFSEDAVYWNKQFLTASLVFTVTLFIYHLVINPGVFRFKFPGVHRVVHHSENDSIKYHEQKFCKKFAFQGSIEQGYLSKHVKIQFLGCQ